MNIILGFILMTQVINNPTFTSQDLSEFKINKKIPAVIEQNVLKALSFYPELKETAINFVFKKNIKRSVMQAQPVFTTLLKVRKEREYQINISSLFKLTHAAIPIHQIPDDIMIGWIGHELGHIMDFESRSNLNVIGFGFKYVFSEKYVRIAEKTADTYAVNRGLGQYIIATKRFILDHTELPQAYKDKIARLYLSPDDIVEQVLRLEEKLKQ
jgi:hypothetical protein